jgi:hypothetical protein
MGIKDAIGFDNHIWPLLAETVAAGKIDLGVLYTLPCQLELQCFVDSIAAA